MGIRMGMPLTQEVLESLGGEEKRFWLAFLSNAEKEINEAQTRNELPSFIPSRYLKEQYEEAVKKYNGKRYCQVRQLETRFDFSIVFN